MAGLPTVQEFRDFFLTEYEDASPEIEATDAIPERLLKRAADVGAYRLTLPPEHGGFGLAAARVPALPRGGGHGPGLGPHARPRHQRPLAPAGAVR